MMGINTGNPESYSDAGLLVMALIGTLAAAVPVAFLSPSLGKSFVGHLCSLAKIR